MLRGMLCSQWYDWVAYFESEPFGEERADLRMAQLCALTANVHRGRGHKAYRPKDFMLDFKPRQAQTATTMKATLEMFTRAHRAMDKG